MWNSLEVRAPFLDKEVGEFVSALPSEMKIRGFTSKKYILKKALKGIPPGIELFFKTDRHSQKQKSTVLTFFRIISRRRFNYENVLKRGVARTGS
jgi:asparagine synthetase B (glutamine-hydrolysing)